MGNYINPMYLFISKTVPMIYDCSIVILKMAIKFK